MELTNSDCTAAKISWLILLAATFLMAGCAGHRSPPAPLPYVYPPTQKTAPQSVRSLLEAHLADWQGVPYRHGGASRKGIDCSAFVQVTFLERFGLPLPRTTKEQALVGKMIETAELASGDLIFFQTAPDKRHVGIYLGDDQFMHVSYSRGVIYSSLSESYWRRHFWQARRVLSSEGRMAAVE